MRTGLTGRYLHDLPRSTLGSTPRGAVAPLAQNKEMRYSHQSPVGDLIGAPHAATGVTVRCRQTSDRPAGVRQHPKTAAIAPKRLSGVDPANRPNQARDAALQAVQRCRRGVPARVSSGLGEPHDTKPVGPAPFRARTTLVRSSASPKRRLRTAQRRPNPVRRQPGTSTTHVPDTSNNSSGLRDAWIC
jgi:hypothetical protein